LRIKEQETRLTLHEHDDDDDDDDDDCHMQYNFGYHSVYFFSSLITSPDFTLKTRN